MKGKHAAARWMLGGAVLVAKYAFAQGCASCYTTTAAGGTQTIHALRDGILVLLVPPAVMFVGVMCVIRTWKGKANSSAAGLPAREKQIPRGATSTAECSCNDSLRCEG